MIISFFFSFFMWYPWKDKLGRGSDFVEKVYLRPPDRRGDWNWFGVIRQGIICLLGVQVVDECVA